ncbi:unnamed protein product [Calypogeia fissa]
MACIYDCGDEMPDSMAWKSMQNEALVKAQRTMGKQKWNIKLQKMEPLPRRLLPFEVFQILSDNHFYMMDIIKGLTCAGKSIYMFVKVGDANSSGPVGMGPT